VKPEDVPDGPLLVDTDVFSWITWRRERYEEFDRLITGHTRSLLRHGWRTAGRGNHRRLGREEMARARRPDRAALRRAYVYGRCDVEVGGDLRAFRGQLKDGGINDMWTAACALAQPEPPPIATGNLADFERIATEFPLRLVHPDVDA
jgi:predicted nucleic acid-binding protein